MSTSDMGSEQIGSGQPIHTVRPMETTVEPSRLEKTARNVGTPPGQPTNLSPKISEHAVHINPSTPGAAETQQLAERLLGG